MFYLCAPAIIYLLFSITQIIIDTFRGLYNKVFIKIFVTILFTFFLNTLCQLGMSIISWIIVFIPFLFMTIIVSILLYIFGLNETTGSFEKCKNPFHAKIVIGGESNSFPNVSCN